MYQYKCHDCGGLCDPGELENGVCWDCREKASRQREEQSLHIRMEFNRKLHFQCTEQPDGQLALRI